MKEIKNQRGFATLEIILAVAIIGILSTVTVPKMARLVDKVCLDYEMKHLYSDLNLARSIGKSSNFNDGISNFNDIENGGAVELWIYSDKSSNATAKNRYQIMRPSVSAYPNYRHYLTNDIKLVFLHGNALQKFTFNNKSRYGEWSKTIALESKFNYKTEIYFDSVGRWRGAYVQ